MMSSKQQQEQKPNNRKRSFQASSASWKDLPAFCDVAAAVSAPTYAARRLPELQQLWYTTTTTKKQQQNQLQDNPTAPPPSSRFSSVEIPYLSGGGKPSSRHLRRRITSFASTKRHRFPLGKDTQLNTPDGQPKPNSSRQTAKSRHARRRNRQDLQQVHQTWSESAGTTTADLPQIENNNSTTLAAIVGRTTSKEVGTVSHSSPSPPVFWMVTHLWHAKRFHMLDLWNWKVPMLHTNRGTRATLRFASDGGTLLQDVTWKYGQPIVLDLTCGLTTLPAAFALCLPTVAFTKGVVCGVQMAEGMLHTPNQFPGGAIAPAMIWINLISTSQSQRETHDVQNTAERVRVYIWVHPSVRSKAMGCFRDWAEHAKNMDTVIQEPSFTASNSPKACLHLRGKSATSALRQLQLSASDGSTLWDWAKLNDCPNLHEMLPHGSVLFVKRDAQQQRHGDQDGVTSKADDELNKGTNDYASEISSMQEHWDSNRDTTNAVQTDSLKSDDIMLVSQCPRNPNLLQNSGCCGWDIWMDPQKVHDVFLTLVLQGKACPIGMLDEAHLRLECEPPLTVFPRDFPDTDEGTQYWQNANQEWRFVRICLEGGWGRVNVASLKKSNSGIDKQAIGGRPFHPIHWSEVVTESPLENMEEGNVDSPEKIEEPGSPVDTDTTVLAESSPTVVVMRGAQFGQPLLHAIQCCGQLPPLPTTETPRRRKRRKVKPPHELTHTIPNSREQKESFHEMIEGLLQALCLPAVVSCRILIHSRGTLDSGFKIWACGESNHDDELIGFVTAGTFSPGRGRCHGVGFIGAARFLRSLLRVSSGGAAGRVVVQPDGSRQVETLVRVTHGKPISDHAVVSHQATISLLLE